MGAAVGDGGDGGSRDCLYVYATAEVMFNLTERS